MNIMNKQNYIFNKHNINEFFSVKLKVIFMLHMISRSNDFTFSSCMRRLIMNLFLIM